MKANAIVLAASLVFLGYAQSDQTGESPEVVPATGAVEEVATQVVLCGGCGEFKGMDKCCAEGATACDVCGLTSGSPGCYKIEKGTDVTLCSDCGQAAGSEVCCVAMPKCAKPAVWPRARSAAARSTRSSALHFNSRVEASDTTDGLSASVNRNRPLRLHCWTSPPRTFPSKAIEMEIAREVPGGLLIEQKETGVEPFVDRLDAAVHRTGTPVLVGIDPRAELLPQSLRPLNEKPHWLEKAEAIRTFCHGLIDVVAPLVPCVKPQAAFFEQLGAPGMGVLAEVISYACNKGLLVILDGKRNDIGSTAQAYAEGILGRSDRSPWGADALTVSPYLGDDSLQPFVDVAVERSAGIFVLVKTSNPGGGMFQDLIADGRPVYRHVADQVEKMAVETVGRCGYGAVGAVVGATYPEQLAELRQQMPHTWFLVPGFGSQGGTARDVAAAFDPRGTGAIVNNSRGIIFAYRREEYAQRFGEARWQDAVDAATRDMIDQLRADTPAGKLGV